MRAQRQDYSVRCDSRQRRLRVARVGQVNCIHHAPNHEILSKIARGQREFGWEERFVTWMVPTT